MTLTGMVPEGNCEQLRAKGQPKDTLRACLAKTTLMLGPFGVRAMMSDVNFYYR